MNSSVRGMNISYLAGAIALWLGWVFVLVYTSPESNSFSIFYFYSILVLAITLTIFWLETTIRHRYFVLPVPLAKKTATRHGILAALLVTSYLVFQSQQIWSWWLAGSILLLVIAVEATFNL